MIDIEVVRLRQLRNTALRARAIAMALDAGHSDNDSVLSRSALVCWRIARVITGKLRAHPYESYQRDPGYLHSLTDGVVAALMGGVARLRGGRFGMYTGPLRKVARRLDDARALTWSPTLSDTLGRLQTEIRLLTRELEAAAPVQKPDREAKSRRESRWWSASKAAAMHRVSRPIGLTWLCRQTPPLCTGVAAKASPRTALECRLVTGHRLVTVPSLCDRL